MRVVLSLIYSLLTELHQAEVHPNSTQVDNLLTTKVIRVLQVALSCSGYIKWMGVSVK